MKSNMHLRGVDRTLMNLLKKEAAIQKTSVNNIVLLTLKRNFGLTTARHIPIYHDLDALAGTWTKKQTKEFEKNISHFEKIDKDIWK